MKKIVLFVLMMLFLVVPMAAGSVTGECVNCHTMHNSQNGQAVASSGTGAAWDGGKITGGASDVANAQLLVADCVGCHSSVGTETIIPLGTSRIPIVNNISVPDKPLAGGNFYWVQNDDTRGHNVYGISLPDPNHPDGAPGSNVSTSGMCGDCHGTLASSASNSGCKACHLAQHHAKGTGTVADGDDGWYRFLGNSMTEDRNAPGVIGIEDPNWEQEPTSAAHNVYKGTTTAYGENGSTVVVDGSMGSFCSGCHSVFHAESSAGGAWVRHPSDVVLPDDVGLDYKDYTVYNPMVPVARPVINEGDTSNGTVTPGTDMVTCLSCHRAHGSPHADMLRWDYENDCSAGTANAACGCFTCHTSKDD